MTVREIVLAHLRKIGADGLCCEDCGCGVDDLIPCSGPHPERCVPAMRTASKDGVLDYYDDDEELGARYIPKREEADHA